MEGESEPCVREEQHLSEIGRVARKASTCPTGPSARGR